MEKSSRRFNVVIAKEDGGVEMYPMRGWLRANPAAIPEGCSLEKNNTWSLTKALVKNGWRVLESEHEVRLLMPTDNRHEILESVLGEEDEQIELEETEEYGSRFALEHQLRDFLAQNLSTILVEGKKLKLYEDLNQRSGVEYPTSVGNIDLLATDSVGNFYVFELKRARSTDETIGQISRYMGWVKRNLADGKDVFGIIVAREISERLKYGVLVFPNVSLFEYEIKFKLNLAEKIRDA